MLNGARQLMDMRPEWIKSSVGSGRHGFPPVQNGSDEKNDFAAWVHGDTELPPQGAKMNCWEAVIFSAHLGGLVTREDIKAAYTEVQNNRKGNRENAFWRLMGRMDAIPKNRPDVSKVRPQPGSIVFTDNNSDIGNHVFLADENGMAFSHDNSESAQGLKYHEKDGYILTFGLFEAKGVSSEDYMVRRRRRHLIAYKQKRYDHPMVPGQLEVRFISPTIFLGWRELPRNNT